MAPAEDHLGGDMATRLGDGSVLSVPEASSGIAALAGLAPSCRSCLEIVSCLRVGP